MGIGLPGVSNYSGMSASISNPAHWGLIGYTYGNISLGLDTYRATDNSSSARNTMFGIESFQFAFPILRSKLGASISFTPLVRSDYQRQENGEFDPVPGLDVEPVRFLKSTVGSGGANRFEVGLGYRLLNNISVGYAFSVNLLAIENSITPIFSSLQFRASPYDVAIEGYDFGHRFGLYAFKSGLFNSEDQLAFGASLSLPVSIDAERTVSSFRSVNLGSRLETLIILNEGDPNRTGTVKLPLEFNAGLTYNLNRLTNVVGEVQLQNWGDAEYSFDLSQQEYFKDRMRAGIGFQYHPYRSDQRDGFFSNFKYSIGTTYDNGHLSIQDQDIETIFLNAGIGLMSRSQSSIDLSVHYGIRGTESSNLVKENIWGFKLSLNLAELMFIQQKFQ